MLREAKSQKELDAISSTYSKKMSEIYIDLKK